MDVPVRRRLRRQGSIRWQDHRRTEGHHPGLRRCRRGQPETYVPRRAAHPRRRDPHPDRRDRLGRQSPRDRLVASIRRRQEGPTRRRSPDRPALHRYRRPCRRPGTIPFRRPRQAASHLRQSCRHTLLPAAERIRRRRGPSAVGRGSRRLRHGGDGVGRGCAGTALGGRTRGPRIRLRPGPGSRPRLTGDRVPRRSGWTYATPRSSTRGPIEEPGRRPTGSTGSARTSCRRTGRHVRVSPTSATAAPRRIRRPRCPSRSRSGSA